MKHNTFNFLDVKFTITANKLNTSVYIKPTDTGLYTHFNSCTLYNYKISSIKTLLYRAIKLCSTWLEFHVEVQRLQQIFVNNGYPQRIVDNIIKKVVNKYNSRDSHSSDDTNKLNLFVQLFDVNSYKYDEKLLNNIINNHVKPIKNYRLKIISYYRPKNLAVISLPGKLCHLGQRMT
jgi:hypothetical protein